jgi:hypothetical protein
MFFSSSDRAMKGVALAALGLRAGEVRSLLRQEVVSAVATVLAIVMISGVAAIH